MEATIRGRRNGHRSLALTLGALVLLAACGGDKAPSTGGRTAAEETPGQTSGPTDKGNVTIGLLNPTTGPFAAIGADVNAGFEHYLEEKNGALSGYKVQLVKEDEANNAQTASLKARQMVEVNKVDAIVGLVNSGVAYGVADYVNTQGVPMLITVAGADGLTQARGSENVFRVSYTSSQDTMPMGEYACKEKGYETAVVIGLDYAFGWEAAGGFSRVFTDSGCKVVQEIYAPLGTPDWASYVQRIDKNADAVFAVIAGTDAIRFLQAYRDFGVKLPIVAHGSMTDEQLLTTQAQTAEGVVSSLHYSAVLDNEVNNKFREGFEEKFKRTVSQYSEDGYAAAQVIEAALAKVSGDPTPRASSRR